MSDENPQGQDENKPESVGVTVGGIAGDHLRSYIERIERLEEEKKVLAEDIKEIYSELKGTGFDQKVVRKLISLRKLEDHDRLEQEEIMDLYKRAIGMN